MNTGSFSAGLLAGGSSLRMGLEKARLPFRGASLWQYQVTKLQALEPAEVLISGRAGQHFAEYRVVRDEVSSAGPLAGVAALLAAATTEWLIVLAVDMPFISPEFLEILRPASPPCGVIPQAARGYEPLAALYPKAAGPLAQELLRGDDRSLQNFAQRLIAEGLGRAHPITSEDESMFRSLNSPAEWQKALLQL